MDFALWTRGAVMELIARECGVSLKIRAVGNYLKRWGCQGAPPTGAAVQSLVLDAILLSLFVETPAGSRA